MLLSILCYQKKEKFLAKYKKWNIVKFFFSGYIIKSELFLSIVCYDKIIILAII